MVRYIRVLVFAMAIGGLAACYGPGAGEATTGTPEDEAAIRAVLDQWGQAYSAKDAAALGNLVTDDYEEVTPDGSHITNREGLQSTYQAELSAIPAEVPFTLTVTTDFIRWIGADAATAGGTWTVSGPPPGSGPERGSWLGLMLKGSDGQWRMANGLGAAYLPPPAAPPAGQ